MKVMYERVAGIDVHKQMIKVAIRSPGDKPWTRTTEIFEYRTFYGVLQQMAADLRRRGVTHVVMEASGVYTEPVYYALCEQDFGGRSTPRCGVAGRLRAAALPGGAASRRADPGRQRVRNPADPHQQDMGADDRDQDDGDQDDMPHQHLAEVHDVEERADPDRVERVLAAGRDPLRVEILLGNVPGKALDDRGHEGDHAGDPGPGPLPRQAAIQNLPQRWITSSAMKSSMLHRCRLLKKWPTGL